MQNGFLLVKPTHGVSDKPDHTPANTDWDSCFVLELEGSLPLFLLLFSLHCPGNNKPRNLMF